MGLLKAFVGACVLVLGCQAGWAVAAKPTESSEAGTQAKVSSAGPAADSKSGAKAAEAGGKAGPTAKVEPSDSESDGATGGWRGVASRVAGGLGLMWLASSLGFDAAAGLWLLVPVLLLLGAACWTWMNRPGKKLFVSGPAMSFDSPRQGPPAELHQAREYSPKNVGNDASARPWETQVSSFQSSRFSDTQSEPAASNTSSGWGVPAGFDVAAFLEASKTNFISLQAAWDRADIPSLRAMMTDDMINQIRTQLTERERHSPGVANVTEVVMLEAHLLGVEEGETGWVASVEFSGLIREDVSAGPSPFREVWNITRPKAGSSGWLVAGVQALQ